MLLVMSSVCRVVCPAQVVTSSLTTSQGVRLPPAFPLNSYTPHGYIDNPYHSMVFNRSGVIRSFPPLGFGWWRADFKGSYGGGSRDHVNYFSILQMGAAIDGKVFARSEDFVTAGTELSSAYHTKHVVSYDWEFGSVRVSLKYLLPREHTLACLVELENTGSTRKRVVLYATHICEIGETRWWGSDGLTARYSSVDDATVSKVWAYGDVFVLGSNLKSSAHRATSMRQEWEGWIREDDTTSSMASAFTKGRGPLWSLQRYAIDLGPNSNASALICLSRGKNEVWARRELRTGLREALSSLKDQLADDQRFWSQCPVLQGDWPEVWKRGWVYDFETLRMNVRRPIGIFKHPWDAMQIHSPRVVLGETSLDMMTLSYADPALAKEVLYGTFADALMPNVPCAREDGSVNMISSDGSECGTAPMWGFPFHVIKSIYLSTLDARWLASLYPFLKGYVEWWLANRTDKKGWLHCNNSWESGQDGSRRFLVAEQNEGAVADFVRTVDVEASMAEAMKNLAYFARIVGKGEEAKEWKMRADQRVRNAQSMFVDGWYRDVDARTEKPIILKDYYDVMMLTPLTCGVATQEQVRAVRPMFDYFREHPTHSLEWPPHLFAYAEAAWNAGKREVAVEVVATTADRVYRRIDAREVTFKDPVDPFSYRIPGVANEFWPQREVPPGGENYGWGATLPMYIIRSIVGFREGEALSKAEFHLAPTIPEEMLQPGKKYEILNLKYRKHVLYVTYEVKGSRQLGISIEYRSPQRVSVSVVDESNNEVFRQPLPRSQGTISFDGTNGADYLVTFTAPPGDSK